MFAETNYIIHGFKKGGSHAITNWIVKQIPTKISYYNECKIINKEIKFTRFTWRFNQNKKQYSNIYLFQNTDISETIRLKFNKTKDQKHIILLRDVLNWGASIYKTQKIEIRYLNNFNITLWKKFAKEYLNNSSKYIFILYNKWFVDEDYRKAISTKLELDFNDIGKNKMFMKEGSGSQSSFDKDKYKNNPESMNVLTRFKEFAEDDKFLKMFDEESLELNGQIFGNFL